MATKQRLELTWYNKDRALIPTEAGKYGYTWVHPSDPRYCETRPLVMDEYVEGIQSPKEDVFQYSERADFTPCTDNLLIQGESGDVLEALTRVPELASKYVGQVKLIYIDPPFNTEQTFTHYEDNLEHSIWLTMMRDRLIHMKRLLSASGSIWVHLDDNEVHRMRALLDEVFGITSFVATIAWEKNPTRENRTDISRSQDYILIYSKTPRKEWKSVRNLLPSSRSQLALYSNPDGDPRGPWSSLPLHAKAEEGRRAEQFFTITGPTGKKFDPPAGRCWLFTESRYSEMLQDNRIWFGVSGDNAPRLKKFLNEVQEGLVPRTLWPTKEVGSSGEGKDEVLRVIGEPFSTPKPERLIERVIQIGSNPGDLVLDVFAGSGTTASVAQKMGRRWITCELLPSTFDQFTRARLEKVVHGLDQGGVTMTPGERVPAAGGELPEGVAVEDAATFTKVMNKLLAEDSELKKSSVVKQLKARTKTTRTKTVVNWRGGGGFQVAHLAPACFDCDADLDRVVLTEAATGETLINSVAANLGFARLSKDEDMVFDGKRGRTLLKVNEGVLDTAQADEWIAQLEEDQKLLIATTGLVDGVREHLRRRGHGSQVKHIPDDLFRYSQENDQ